VKLDTAPPRGMKDLLPPEVELRDRASATILSTYRRYGFRRVETPALENLKLLLGSGGGENEKLIYKVLKRGAKLDAATHGEDDLADLGLRFDLTVPLARYYAHNRATLPDPFKAIQIGPVWRAERPQKGRFRQFTQCDIDILGVASEIAEIELILATAAALVALGLEQPRVRVNDRRILAAMATHCGVDAARHGEFFIVLDKLDKIGPDGVERELLAAGYDQFAIASLFGFALPKAPGDSSDQRLERLAKNIPATAEAVEGLRTIVRAVAREAGERATLEFDPSLVRGMGYYTGPIFEAVHGGGTSAIAGGGRYDRMVGRLLGHDVPACGFSIGFERVVSILEERSEGAGSSPDRIAFLFDRDDPLTEVVAAASRLRSGDRVVSLTLKRKNLAKQLDDLAGEGFGSYAVLRPGPAGLEIRPLARRAGAGGPTDG
jgi:histidyl-tRNA synthetase